MKSLLATIFLSFILLKVCSAQELDRVESQIDFETFSTIFNEKIGEIDQLSISVRRIDTFTDGNIWDNQGYALIERDVNDTLFGFSFYGVRSDFPNEYIYDKGLEFYIFPEEKSYQVLPGHYGFLGIPGGQMIYPNIFKLDSIYKEVELDVKEDSYVLQYTFEDNKQFEITERKKKVFLSKETFLPMEVIVSYEGLGNKATHQYLFREMKINESVTTSIKELKDKIADYHLIPIKERQPSFMLLRALPEVLLPKLDDPTQMIGLAGNNKLVLLDFWEVWCGPCIASFPKVQKLQETFGDNLQVMGILTEDTAKALELVEKKEVSFINLVGTKELLTQFRVDSFPRYFLVDNSGIIRKEYFGYSDQIELDIEELLGK